MDPTIKAVDNILDGLNAEAPERKYCDRHKKHKYHKGIAGGKRCVYCGYMKWGGRKGREDIFDKQFKTEPRHKCEEEDD